MAGSRSEAPARRRLSPDDRRAQLAAVGVEVFTTRGYQATTLEDIAAAAGITRPLIYHYFRDKDELYAQIVMDARAQLDTALFASFADADGPAEQLRAGLHAYFAFVRERGPQWDLLFGGGIPVAGELAASLARGRFETAERLAILVRRAAPHLDAVAASAYAHAISGAAEQLAKWWRQHPEVSLEQIVGHHLDTVWTGLASQVR